MNILKKALLGATMVAALATSAQAAIVSVGGVTWDTAAVNSTGIALDFSGNTDSVNQLINPVTGEVTGTGLITRVNENASFCASCTLTYEFGGFGQTSGSLPAPGSTSFNHLTYSGGWVKVYVNTGGLSELWLDMVGHEINGVSLDGYINQIGGTVTNMFGGGFLDVVGGLAESYFDTNAMVDGADFTFSTTFTTIPNVLNAQGSGTFTSKTAEVPEPASIALMGLGLLGLAAGRRKQAK